MRWLNMGLLLSLWVSQLAFRRAAVPEVCSQGHAAVGADSLHSWVTNCLAWVYSNGCFLSLIPLLNHPLWCVLFQQEETDLQVLYLWFLVVNLENKKYWDPKVLTFAKQINDPPHSRSFGDCVCVCARQFQGGSSLSSLLWPLFSEITPVLSF